MIELQVAHARRQMRADQAWNWQPKELAAAAEVGAPGCRIWRQCCTLPRLWVELHAYCQDAQAHELVAGAGVALAGSGVGRMVSCSPRRPS